MKNEIPILTKNDFRKSSNPSVDRLCTQNYEIKIGKHKGKKLSDLEPKILDNYILHVRNEALKKNETITGHMSEFIDTAGVYLGTFDD